MPNPYPFLRYLRNGLYELIDGYILLPANVDTILQIQSHQAKDAIN